MAKKRLNKKLVITLLVVMVVLAVGSVVGFLRYWYQDAGPYFLEGYSLMAQAKQAERDNIAQVADIKDFRERQKQLDELNEEVGKEFWSKANSAFQKAYKYSRNDQASQIEACHALKVMYWHRRAYGKSMGAYRGILQLDGTNIEAKRGILEYSYDLAKGYERSWQVWDQVKGEAEELLELAPDDMWVNLVKAHSTIMFVHLGASDDSEGDMASAAVSLDKVFELDDGNVLAHKLRALWLYVKAESLPDAQQRELLEDQASEILQACIEKNTDDVESYINLFELSEFRDVARKYQAVRSAGNAADRAAAEALASDAADAYAAALDDAIELFPSEARFVKKKAELIGVRDAGGGRIDERIELYRQIIALFDDRIEQAKASEDAIEERASVLLSQWDSADDDGDSELFGQCRMEMLSLMEDEMEVKSQLFEAALDKAQNESQLATLLYIRGLWSDTPESDLAESYALFHDIYYYPDMLGDGGVFQARVRGLRYGSIPTFVNVCAKLAELSEAADVKEGYLSVGGQFVAEYRETLTGENASVKLVEATLLLVQGDAKAQRAKALRLLYEADQQQTLEKQSSVNTKNKLFEALRDTEHHSLAVRYGVYQLELARRFGWDVGIPVDQRHPRMLVERMDAAAKLGDAANVRFGLFAIGLYEQQYGDDKVYRDHVMKTKAQFFVRQGLFSEVGEIVKGLEGDDKDLRVLQAQSFDTVTERAESLVLLLKDYPAEKSIISGLYGYYMKQGTDDPCSYDKMRSIIATALETDPTNRAFKEMKLLLRESDPGKVSDERRSEIRYEVLKGIEDDFERENSLGEYCQRMSEVLESKGDKEGALEYRGLAKEHFEALVKLRPDELVGFRGIFDILLANRQWSQVKELIAKVRKRDESAGLLFEGQYQAVYGSLLDSQQRRDEAEAEYRGAKGNLESYLESRPIAPRIRIVLSQVYARLGQLDDAIKQAWAALEQNTSDIRSSRVLALLLHDKYRREGLGNLETRKVAGIIGRIDSVLGSVPTDPAMCELRLTYNPLLASRIREQISKADLNESQRMAIQKQLVLLEQTTESTCRRLIKDNPSNSASWRSLASLLYQRAMRFEDISLRAEQLAEVESVCQESLKANPGSQVLSVYYSELLRELGRLEDAEKVLSEMVSGTSDESRNDAKVTRAMSYGEHGEFVRAEALLGEVLDDDPCNYRAILMLANLQNKQGQFGDAAASYSRARGIKDDERLMARNVELLVRAGKVEVAQELLEVMRERYPEYVGTQLLTASLELRKANYDVAIASVDEVLSNNPLNGSAMLIKSEALFYGGKYQESLDCIENYPEGDSNEGQMRLLRSQILQRLERTDDAIMELQVLIGKESANVRARTMLIKLLRVRKRWYDIEKLYDDTITKFPRVVSWYVDASSFLLSYSGMQSDRQAARLQAKALELVRQAWQVSKETGQHKEMVLDRLLQVLIALEKYDDALAEVSDNMSGQPGDAVLLVRKAEVFYRQGKKAEALSIFEEALTLSSEIPQLSDMVLSNVLRVGDLDEMLVWCSDKLSSHPDWPTLYLVVADLYGRKGQLAQQVRVLEDSKSVIAEELSDRVDMLLANAYNRLGDSGKTVSIYRRLLIERPDDVSLLNNLAYVLLQSDEDIDEAVTMAEKANRLAGGNPNVMDTYAVALLKKQDYAQARQVMERAVQEVQRLGIEVQPEFYYHLAQAQIGVGETEQGREVLIELRDKLEPQSQIPSVKRVLDDVVKLLESLE